MRRRFASYFGVNVFNNFTNGDNDDKDDYDDKDDDYDDKDDDDYDDGNNIEDKTSLTVGLFSASEPLLFGPEQPVILTFLFLSSLPGCFVIFAIIIRC